MTIKVTAQLTPMPLKCQGTEQPFAREQPTWKSLVQDKKRAI
jgi:hypothetical protein